MGGDGGKKEKGKRPPEKGDEGSSNSSEAQEAPIGLLARLRPRRRVVFFLAFIGFCCWIMAFYDPCQVEEKARKDCGFSGISPSYCMTGSCFTSRGGKLEKKTIKVSRKKGAKLGVEVIPDTGKGDLVLVQSISDGAVLEHNSKLPADSSERMMVGDAIAKVDGSAKGLTDALSRTSEKTVEIEIRRSSLPSFLKWMRSSAKPGPIETVLTAPGFKRWSKLTSQLGTVGLASWLVSGYGPASLPVWYFGFSAAVGYKLVRCCHDEHVQAKVPHCYRPVEDELPEVLQKARDASVSFAQKLATQWRSLAEEVMASYRGANDKKKDKKKRKKDKSEI